ncbi:MAG: hypothetical protein [Bacteriophage sp.]|nr:MAG: hypothetical protein [Bacteriophage sp.]
MGIPVPDLYSDKNGGAGQIATIEDRSVNHAIASARVKFGTAVAIDPNASNAPTPSVDDSTVLVKQATSASDFYGITTRRAFATTEPLTKENLDNQAWEVGEVLSVLRDGTIWVQIADDVTAGDKATVDASGLLKKANEGDFAIGQFLSSGKANSVARCQIRVQLNAPTAPAQTKTVKSDKGE